MGSSWTLENTTLTVKGLTRPFKVEDVRFDSLFVRGVEPTEDGWVIKIRLKSKGAHLNMQVALAQLKSAGYLDTAQSVRVKKLDSHTVLVEFEHQLPADFTNSNLQHWLKYASFVADERIIVISSATNRRDQVERALQELWDKLHAYKVVKTSQPPKF